MHARIVNKYRRILLCSVFLLLVLSCNEDVSDYSAPKFKKVVEDPKIEYIGDVLPFNKIDNIFRYKDRLYVIAYHHKQKNYLHVYDVNDGTHLYSSLHQGNGPGEIIYPGAAHFEYETGMLYFYDVVRAQAFSFHIGDSLTFINQTVTDDSVLLSQQFPASDGSDISVNSYFVPNPRSKVKPAPRIIKRDPYRDTLAVYDIFPEIEDQKMLGAVDLSHNVSLSPDRSHLAIASLMGSILEIFEISEDKIDASAKKYFVEPEHDTNNKSYSLEDTILGFCDIFLTNKYVYGAYDGENYGTVSRDKLHNNIAVFDFEGHPRELYKLGHRVHKLCVDEELGKIYCLIWTGEEDMRLASIDIVK